MENGIDESLELKALVGELEGTKDKDSIVGKLQEIGKKLITEYIIVVDRIEIQPLWVEAYYYNINSFPDCNSHLNEMQKNRFGQLYFHREGRGGFDICLSNSDDYYLSFLLKATMINGKFNTQMGIYDVLSSLDLKEADFENIINVLVKREKPLDYRIECVKRVGITKPCYKEEQLAAFPIEVLNKNECNFTFAHKELIPLVLKYNEEYMNNKKNYTKKDSVAYCREVFGWVPDDLIRFLRELT